MKIESLIAAIPSWALAFVERWLPRRMFCGLRVSNQTREPVEVSVQYRRGVVLLNFIVMPKAEFSWVADIPITTKLGMLAVTPGRVLWRSDGDIYYAETSIS